jgi:hypothetical protein
VAAACDPYDAIYHELTPLATITLLRAHTHADLLFG